MELNNVNFVIDKIGDLTYVVKRLERFDRELSTFGLDDSPSEYGVSFADKTIIFKDGTKEKVSNETIALLRGSRSALENCERIAGAVVKLCEQGDIQSMNKKTELSRLYGRKSFLYQAVTDVRKLEKFKKELRRARKKQDNEAIVALVKILKKIGY